MNKYIKSTSVLLKSILKMDDYWHINYSNRSCSSAVVVQDTRWSLDIGIYLWTTRIQSYPCFIRHEKRILKLCKCTYQYGWLTSLRTGKSNCDLSTVVLFGCKQTKVNLIYINEELSLLLCLFFSFQIKKKHYHEKTLPPPFSSRRLPSATQKKYNS